MLTELATTYFGGFLGGRRHGEIRKPLEVVLRIQFEFGSAYGCSLARSLLALPGRYAALRCGLVRIGLRTRIAVLWLFSMSRGFVQAYGDLREFWHATSGVLNS